MLNKVPKTLALLDILTLAGLAAAFALVLLYTPVELDMGLVQKVFYFHVAATWTGMLGFLLATITSIAYLRGGDIKWDSASVAGIEIGMVFVGLGIITGSIWARPIWNTWWTWDPRLTTTLIMELLYAAYFILRGSLSDPTQRARLASIYAIAGFASVPLTFLSIRIFRTIHPVVIGGSAGGTFAMTGPMVTTFIFSLGVFSLLFIALFWHRYRLERTTRALEEQQLRQHLEEE